MPARRLSMRKIREVLRLKFGLGLKDRAIARSCSIPRSSVANYVFRAKQAGLRTWPLVPDLGDEALEELLFPPVVTKVAASKAATPDFAWMHEELRRHKHVTLQLLWEEYKEAQPEGYQYSQFCELYRRWARKIDVVLRQEHHAGEKMFVDHAGPDGAHCQPGNRRDPSCLDLCFRVGRQQLYLCRGNLETRSCLLDRFP